MKNALHTIRPWWITAATLFAAALIFFFGRGSLPKPGQSTNVVITLVPGDALGLACASSGVLSNQRCAYDDQQQPTGVERPLRPYVTVGRELLLLSGVFESMSVREWLSQARQAGNDARVTVTCRAQPLGAVAATSVRWAPDGPFQPEHNVMTANVNDCTVQR